MAKPLSQEEIDVLLDVRGVMEAEGEHDLGALESMMVAGAEERAQPYNFKRPRLFSQDQMRVLHYVHEAFARDLSVYLSAQLRTLIDITLTAVDQVIYSEFVMSSAPPSALYVVEAENLDHKLVVELDPRLIVCTIEKLFGGQGLFPETAREVSQIEQRIMSKVMVRAFRELEGAWEQAHDLTLNEVAFESHAEFVQIIPAVEPALVATYEVTIYDQRSFINICYPYLLLEKILGQTGIKQWISASTTPPPPEVRERYEEALRQTDVTLTAELGHTKLSVAELQALEAGDVVLLDRRVDEPMHVYVNGKRKFRAAAGRSGRHRALRISNVLAPAHPEPLIPDALATDET